MPDSIVGELLCGRYATSNPAAVMHWMFAHRLLLGVVVVVVLGLRLTWALVRRSRWRRWARAARFAEITPPVTATPAGTLGLWRLLATLLPAPRRFSLCPTRLVWEVEASAGGTRCGIWIPAGITPTAVARIVQRAWPGARLTLTAPPQVARRRPLAGRVMGAQRPEWLPLADELPSLHRRAPALSEEDDQIRAVFDGLAAAGRTGGGLLQIVVSRAPRARLAALRRATVNPQRAGRARGAARGVLAVLEVARAGLLAVLDLFQPGPSSRRTPGASAADPYTAALAGQARTKYAAGPHFLITIRALACGPTRAAAKAASEDITSGYSLVSAHLAFRRLTQPRAAATWRTAPARHQILVSVAELAALAGVPAEPAAYGLPAAAARRRPPADTDSSANTKPAPATGPRLRRRPARSSTAFVPADEPVDEQDNAEDDLPARARRPEVWTP